MVRVFTVRDVTSCRRDRVRVRPSRRRGGRRGGRWDGEGPEGERWVQFPRPVTGSGDGVPFAPFVSDFVTHRTEWFPQVSIVGKLKED